MSRIHNYYFAGFIFCSALLNMFLEYEAAAIKILCIILLLGNFVFASLFHCLKVKSSNAKNKPKE